MRIKINAFQSCLLIIFSLFFASISLAAVPDKAKTQKDKVTVKPVAAAKPATATAATTGSAAKAPPININTANLKTLEALPGIGTATAKNIVAARPFKKVEDLEKVKGVGKAKYDAIKDKVTIKTVAAPQPATAATVTTGSVAKASPVNINTADLKTLEALPGVGTATAKNIVAARPFKKVEDLEKVKGIGKTKFASLKDKVTVEEARRVGITPVGKVPVAAVESEKKGITATQPSGSEPLKALPVGSININTADQKTLEALPGIGPVKAKAIIDHRPYTKVEDIMKVPGIKEGIFSKIKDQIVVK